MIVYKEATDEMLRDLKNKMVNLAIKICYSAPEVGLNSNIEELVGALAMEVLCRVTNLSFDELMEKLGENNIEWSKEYMRMDAINKCVDELAYEITTNLKAKEILHAKHVELH